MYVSLIYCRVVPHFWTRYRSQLASHSTSDNGRKFRWRPAKQPLLPPSSDFSSVMWKADIIGCWLECCCHLSDCNHASLLVLRSSPSASTRSGECQGQAGWTRSVCVFSWLLHIRHGEERDCTLFFPSWTIPSAIWAPQETRKPPKSGKIMSAIFAHKIVWKLFITSQSGQSCAALLFHIFRRFIWSDLLSVGQHAPPSENSPLNTDSGSGDESAALTKEWPGFYQWEGRGNRPFRGALRRGGP